MNVFELIKEKLEKASFADIDEQYADDGQRMLFLYDAISIVDEVTQEYNNGWIPCSERLPDEEKYYLVTMVTEEIRIFKYKPSEKRWQDRTGCIEYGLIAWQPLPAPYKEGGVDDGK